jgi:hypothetical protein
MKTVKKIIFFLVLFLINGCVVQFIPEINEDKYLLVVEGLLTDQLRRYTVKLSNSVPVGSKNKPIAVKNASLSITDDLGNRFLMVQKLPGTYITDSLTFRGVVGRKYTLHILTGGLNYESTPMEMKPVPQIDSVYYENKVDETSSVWKHYGFQVYLNTHDPANNCKYFRWEYVETWKIVLPYQVPNKVCWVSGNSSNIYLKNTSVLSEDRVTKFPLNYVSDETDRLQERYSLLVNQYSVNEDEYLYWEKLQKISESVGGLYDVTPMTIPSNIKCLENPYEKVLGYFSVSAVASKRIFIDDFRGNFPDLYEVCPSDTIPFSANIPNLNTLVWIIEYIEGFNQNNRQVVITKTKGCADCTVRGTNIKPVFWKEKGEE